MFAPTWIFMDFFGQKQLKEMPPGGRRSGEEGRGRGNATRTQAGA